MTEAKQRPYLAAADVLRVVSVSLVGWYHIWQQSWLDPGFRIGKYYVNLQQMVRNSYMMVDVLLVLSGFLLALPYAKACFGEERKLSVKEFYGNRFWRIVPSYLLVIVLCFVWAAASGQYSSGCFMAKDLITHLTFTHNLFPDVYFTTPLPGVLWTLAVEVQFYLLFPLIAKIYRDQPRLTCLLLLLLGAASRIWIYTRTDTAALINQLPAMLDLYACGMLAALAYARLSEYELKPGVRWAAFGMAVIALLLIFQMLYWQTLGGGDSGRRGQLLWRLPLGLCSGLFLVGGCLAPTGVAKALGNPVTRFCAAISYNFYIWHQFVALRLKEAHFPAYTSELPNQAGEQPWQTRYTLLCFAAAIAVGALLTWLWEKPAARWGRRFRKT